MKKIFLVLARIAATLAAFALGISLLLPGIVDLRVSTGSAVPNNTIFGQFIQVSTPQSVLLYLGFAFIGCALVLFGKNVAKYIGYAVELVAGFLALFAVQEILYSLQSDTTYSMGIGAIVAIIGLSMVIVGILLELLNVLIEKISPEKDTDETILTILKYKKLLDQNIITEDIFLAKRDELLGISTETEELPQTE